ncbi:uncharacterized protein LOC133182645 [Saccostrea echinata]|uniref:uncharacterized protein LOC133182645 n=1 Tax=Saccostrea echinata TaxID=191078 RepID=UPI002A8051B0|nr:uncharacterized protein LOC133182645 [Saccostrea echinata]
MRRNEIRRIVELGVLADGLNCCQLCGQPLQLSNCVGEQKFGLEHILIIKCKFTDCGLVNEVATRSKHQTSNGRSAWDVITKLATGMINGGFDETHVNSLLGALNIPSVSQKTLKHREREDGQQLGQIVIVMSERSLAVSFDGAWQNRDTGRAYNTLTERTSDIVQIAAICGDQSINIHMNPSKRISEGASQVTGLTFEGGILKRHGHLVKSVSAEEGLRCFTQFVASSAKPFLIGQNFDVPV